MRGNKIDGSRFLCCRHARHPTGTTNDSLLLPTTAFVALHLIVPSLALLSSSSAIGPRKRDAKIA
jgi:hypothetical protein